MIGRAIDAMAGDAVERIVKTPPHRWGTGAYVGRSGCACLLAIAAGAEEARKGGVTSASYRCIELVRDVALRGLGVPAQQRRGARGWDRKGNRQLEHRYDAACNRFGLPRIVMLIQSRGRRALERQAVAP